MRPFLLALLSLLVACGPSVGTPAASLAPITVGQRPIRPVPAFGALWIANAADGTVTRVDASTGAIAATIRVGDPQRLLAAGCAPSSEHAYATGSFGLRACDSPSAVAAGAGAVWATANDRNAIVRIDPATNTVTDTVAVGFDAWAVTAGDEAIWVSDYVNDAVVRIDPRTAKVIARIPVAAGPTEMAIAPGTLWVVCSAGGALVRIDTGRGAVVATIPVSAWALAISISGDDVWVRGGSTRGDGGLSLINARTNAVIATFQAGAPQGREGVASIAATERGVWVPGVTLDLVDRATGAIIATRPVPSYAVASDGPWLWVLDVFGQLRRESAR
ncbi:MAG: YncE family protein [Chloroflexota bacterium]